MNTMGKCKYFKRFYILKIDFRVVPSVVERNWNFSPVPTFRIKTRFLCIECELKFQFWKLDLAALCSL